MYRGNRGYFGVPPACVQNMQQFVISNEPRVCGKVVQNNCDLRFFSAFLLARLFDNGELLIQDCLQSLHVRLFKKEFLLGMVRVAHIKDLVFDHLLDWPPYWIHRHTGAKDALPP